MPLNMPIPRALCVPCIVAGIGLCVFAVSASAADGETAGLSVGHVLTLAVGLITALIGAYAKGLERRVSKSETDFATCARSIVDLRELVLSEYHSNSAIRDMLSPISSTQEQQGRMLRGLELQMHALHARLDFAGIGPQQRRMTVPDDGN